MSVISSRGMLRSPAPLSMITLVDVLRTIRPSSVRFLRVMVAAVPQPSEVQRAAAIRRFMGGSLGGDGLREAHALNPAGASRAQKTRRPPGTVAQLPGNRGCERFYDDVTAARFFVRHIAHPM